MPTGRLPPSYDAVIYRKITNPKLDPLIVELIKERHRQRLSLEDLIERADHKFSLTALVSWENGRKQPTLGSLRLWITALGKNLGLIDTTWARRLI